LFNEAYDEMVISKDIEATSSSFIGAFEKDSTRKEFINMLTANLK
jgi:GTP cyclohydrolase I